MMGQDDKPRRAAVKPGARDGDDPASKAEGQAVVFSAEEGPLHGTSGISFVEDRDNPEEMLGPASTLPEEENPDLEAQLADLDGVPNGMGTIALDRTPFQGSHSPMPVSLQANDWSQLSDAEIMQRAGAGDDACLEYLIAKYRRPIVYFMFRMVHNQAIAEELAQEVFLRVYRSRQSYRAEARFSTWLYRIASNLAVNHARDTKYERSASSVYLDTIDEETGTSPDVADPRPSAEQDLLQKERMRQIRAHVMALPERQRMAVLMHKYQGLNYKDIGAVLKLSESATKSLLFRAYQTLREGLKEFV
jgi:RNA polymerase sigma-70 factor (ECF subfamily)